jgi:purine nucleosidase
VNRTAARNCFLLAPCSFRLMRTFLIDTDTASDDAVALIMALRHLEVRVAGITVVSGNVPLEQAVANALYAVELCGRSDVPVYAGATMPLLRDAEHARWFHGKDGLGDQNYPPAKKQCEREHAVDTIVRIVSENPGLTLVTLGPLTNVALAISREPGIVNNIGRCVVMGGNPCCEGNVTPAAEFNVWVDPEAARIVFRSRMPIELVGWHLCRGEANLGEADIAQVRGIGTPLANFCIDCNRTAMEANRVQSGEIGIALPDPVAMAVALDPSLVMSASEHFVEVETHSELTRGQTVVDRLNVADDGRNRGLWGAILTSGRRMRVIWAIDVPRWKRMLHAVLRERSEDA